MSDKDDQDEEKKEVDIAKLPIEIRMEVELMQLRANFYYERQRWLQYRAGGPGNHSVSIAYGADDAKTSAEAHEKGFRDYLEEALLDEDGNTTDERFPMNGVIQARLRILRMMIVGAVAEFLQSTFFPVMSENLNEWKASSIDFHLRPFVQRYADTLLPHIKAGPDIGKGRPTSMMELDEFLEGVPELVLIFIMASRPTLSEVHNYMLQLISEFLLVKIPYRLDAKEPVSKDADKYWIKSEEEKPVVH